MDDIILNYYSNFYKTFENHYQEIKSEILTKNISKTLNEFLFYTPDSKGKLLRSFFTYRSCDLFQIPSPIKENLAVGIELFQSFTLIHDDLPSLDNDDFRRGKPSLHKKTDEANAILIGDALALLSFNIFTRNIEQIIKYNLYVGILNFINFFSSSSVFSLIDGQIFDLYLTSKKSSKEELLKMYEKKTASFFALSLSTGALIKEKQDIFNQLYKAGLLFGMAFQLIDDIIDLEKEKKENSFSFANNFGIKDTKKLIKNYSNDSLNILKKYDREILYPFIKDYLIKYLE